MGLRLQFNLVLTAVFIVGLAASAWISHTLLQENARQEVIRNAELMIEAARAIRTYTVKEVGPRLAQSAHAEFLPQTVPAYAATQTLGLLPADYRDFAYKEATLNPTNPRNRAADWEADLVLAFQRDPGQTYLTGERATPRGSSLYIAAPIRITNKDCLQCHSTPEIAPAAMVARYGKSNGFSWKLNEVVGAQVVSVPMTVPLANANRAFITFIASLCAVFVVLYIALNVMLSTMIVRPIAQMSAAADQVSMGDFTTPEFRMAGKGEIGRLATSFNRMRRSLQQAMKMIEPDDGAT
jgi:protein-histidine pros-kinase